MYFLLVKTRGAMNLCSDKEFCSHKAPKVVDNENMKVPTCYLVKTPGAMNL